jgi:hypothetical protein
MSEPLRPGQLQGLDALVELLDTLIDTGVAIAGDLIISVAGVDLIQLDLRALLTTVSGPAP